MQVLHVIAKIAGIVLLLYGISLPATYAFALLDAKKAKSMSDSWMPLILYLFSWYPFLLLLRKFPESWQSALAPWPGWDLVLRCGFVLSVFTIGCFLLLSPL